MRFGEVDAQGNRIVTEQPKAGETEVWSFVNISADTHPMHLHLPEFDVVERRKFKQNGVNTYAADLAAARAGQPGAPTLLPNNTIDPTSYLEPQGADLGVGANEKGPKDTVRANPAEVTSIKVNFKLPAGATTPAKYVWHCHILEHEENDMMRPYEVVV